MPAVAGLANNPSFSHRLPVQLPTQARLVHFDKHGTVVVGDQHGRDESNPNRGPNASRTGEPGGDAAVSGVQPSEATDAGGNGGVDPTESDASAEPTQSEPDGGGSTSSGDTGTDGDTDHSGSGGHGG